jgi:DinB superfamily
MTAESEDAMTEIDTALAANRDAVEQLIRAGEQSGAAWSTPRAPGKWSPSQIVEHVARGLDEGANIVAGRPTLPMPPAVIRLIARFMFKRVLRKAAFPTGFKALKALNPASGPATPAEGRIRLETAYQKFDEVCRRIAADRRLITSTFGSVPVQDLVRFNELHTRHHIKQMAARQ